MPEILLENAPRKAKELFEKGMAAMERGNLDYAMDTFMACLELEPRLLRARKFLRAAAVKKFKDKKGNALTHMLASLQGFPLMLAAQSMLKKKPDQALRTAEKLMRLDPLNPPFFTLFAQAALAAGMPEAAIQTLEIAKEHYPNDVKLLNWLAKLLLDNERPQDARDCYDQVLRLRPNDPKALKALKDATALATMKKGWDGASSFRDVMKDSKEAILLEQEAKAVKSTQDMSSLLKEMQQKVEREPDNVNYRRSLADLYTRAERFDDALALLEDTLKGAGRADPQIERAISNIRLKQFDHQIEKLRAAGDQANLDKKLKEKDDFVVADSADRVKRYPNDLQFRYEYGVVLYEHNRLNEAIEEFQLAQRNPQRRIRTLYYLALCFKQKQQYDIAIEQLQKAASEMTVMDETKKDILYEMGTLCELMGKPEQAVGHYKEIYSVDIRYKDVAAKVEKGYKK